MENMTSLDMAVMLMVGGGAILGFLRGLIQEVTSLVAWVAAIVAVRLFHTPVTELLTGQVGTAGAAAVLGYVLLFGGVFLIGKWASRAMGQRALLVATLLFMLASLIYDLGFGGDAERPQWMTDSRTYPALAATAGALSTVIAERRAASKAP
jgi:membrane protein required for colicin V production